MAEIPTVTLARQVVVMDGGMGQELLARGDTGSHPLWSAKALIDDPDLVRSVHADYIRAGAEIIITNTYSLLRHKLAAHGIEDRYRDLNALAGALAGQAREAAGNGVLIAGSLPPLFGSYQPDTVRPFAEIEPLYREQAEILAPYVDFFICETMSSAAEGRAAASAATATGKPVWVAWTLVDDGRPLLRSGETIAEAALALAGLDVSGWLANCCAPESISAAMPELEAIGRGVIGGYANGFRGIPDGWAASASGIAALGSRDDLGPGDYARHVETWIDRGARVVGGCCEIGPAHIAEIRDRLAARRP